MFLWYKITFLFQKVYMYHIIKILQILKNMLNYGKCLWKTSYYCHLRQIIHTLLTYISSNIKKNLTKERNKLLSCMFTTMHSNLLIVPFFNLHPSLPKDCSRLFTYFSNSWYLKLRGLVSLCLHCDQNLRDLWESHKYPPLSDVFCLIPHPLN